MEHNSLLVSTIANAALDLLSEDEDEENELFSIIFKDMLFDSVENANSTKSREQHYVDYIVPLYSDEDFKNYFRMTRETFQALFDEIGDKLENKSIGRPTICPKKMLLSAIWMLSTRDTIRSIGERFDMSKSTVMRTVKKVCLTLIENLSDSLRIPTLEEMKITEEGFRIQTGFPGVIGVIDGTHILIKTPKTAAELYVNQKGSHSVHLQAICDDNMLFWDCFCGYPGSVNDHEIFYNSEANEFLCSGQVPGDYHILGDSGYPLTEHLMVPYTNDGNLDKCQKNFNETLLRTKRVIDRAFATLKNRFQRLKYIEIEKTDKVPMYVLAACILHNYCIRQKDYFLCTENNEDFLNPDIPDDTTEDLVLSKRDQLAEMISP